MTETLKGLSAHGHKCALCGLEAGPWAVRGSFGDQEFFFCCPGCRAVYSILLARQGALPDAPTRTDLYRICQQEGIVSSRPWDESQLRTGETHPDQGEGILDLTLRISGLGCPSCAWLLEEFLARSKGVYEARVSFGSDLARVKYFPSIVSPREIRARIRSLGYQATELSGLDEERERDRRSFVRLGISVFLTANVMMISWAVYTAFLEDLSPATVRFLSWPLAALSGVVLFGLGLPVLRQAIAGVRLAKPNMETLVSVGALSAYSYSLLQMPQGSPHVYFDTASMLMTLVLLGRSLEDRARMSVKKSLIEVQEFAGQKARLCTDRTEKWVPSSDLGQGDRVKVRTGETVPIDGRVVQGEGTVDQSALTGETMPVKVAAGDAVLAGSVIQMGELLIEASCDGKKSLIESMAAMVEEALARSSSWERVADRLTHWFVPAVVAIALGTALWAWMHGLGVGASLSRGLTVLVIACPCALGVATPLARVAAVGVGGRQGIWVKGENVLEEGGRVQVMVMDKTGTLTQGQFGLQEIYCPEQNPRDFLLKVTSVELPSNHFLAHSLLLHARNIGLEPEGPQDFVEEPGKGVAGLVDGMRVCVGNRDWMARWAMPIPLVLDQRADQSESAGSTVLFAGWEGVARGILVMGDSIKEGAKYVVSELKRMGIEIWLVSGDSARTTESVARELGVDHYQGEALPHQKAALVQRLSEAGRKVAVVGDGVNDAPALSSAHLGIALGSKLAAPGAAASVHVSRSDPRAVLEVLELCRKARRAVIQNLSFSLAYNAAAIPVAMAGHLNPVLAVLAMFASSLTVIGNSWRLSRHRLGEIQPVSTLT